MVGGPVGIAIGGAVIAADFITLSERGSVFKKLWEPKTVKVEYEAAEGHRILSEPTFESFGQGNY
jgi:hypothetical protein